MVGDKGDKEGDIVDSGEDMAPVRLLSRGVRCRDASACRASLLVLQCVDARIRVRLREHFIEVLRLIRPADGGIVCCSSVWETSS